MKEFELLGPTSTLSVVTPVRTRERPERELIFDMENCAVSRRAATRNLLIMWVPPQLFNAAALLLGLC
jgi:hypothetical protein